MAIPKKISFVAPSFHDKRNLLHKINDNLGKLIDRIRWGWRFGIYGRNAWVEKPFILYGANLIQILADVRIWKMSRLEAFGSDNTIRIKIGTRTVIQPFSHIASAQSIEIGDDCLFASHVYITDHDHDTRNPTVPPKDKTLLMCSSVKIGDRVWLGEKVSILKGVTIGDGVIIGAGSVVTKDIPELCIAAGIPAKVIKKWDAINERWSSLNDDTD